MPAEPSAVEPVEPENDDLSSKTADPDPDWAPTEDPNATVVPGEMRSDQEEIPAPFTKADADKAETMEARARMSRAAVGCQVYWPSPYEVCGVIRDKYNSLGGPGSFLSFPNSPEYTNPDGYGKRTQFLNGPIYWSAATGAHPVVNSFLNRWGIHQYEAGWLKYPTTDEIVLPDGGRRQEFQQGAIYVAFQNAIGSAIANGPIRDKWNSVGAQAGPLGYVSSDEFWVTKNNGRYNNFVNGTITWSQATGARLLYAAVRDRWAQFGREDGQMGYPLSDEQVVPGTGAHYVDFEDGSTIWWSLVTGAWAVSPAVKESWNDAGGPNGALGLPIAAANTVATNVLQGFERGQVKVISSDLSYVSSYEPNPSAGPNEPVDLSSGVSERVLPDNSARQEAYGTDYIEGYTTNLLTSYNRLVVRTGYYSGLSGVGWGYDKAYHLHGVTEVSAILWALESPHRMPRAFSPEEGEVPEGANFYGKVLEQRRDLKTGKLTTTDWQWLYAIYDPRNFTEYKGVPAGNPLGLVTAYCGDDFAFVEECKEWVPLAAPQPTRAQIFPN